jgi:hypothetical protein
MEEKYMVDGVLRTLEELKIEAENFGLDVESFLASIGAQPYQEESQEQDFQEGVAVQMDATVIPEVPDASEKPSTMGLVSDVFFFGFKLSKPSSACCKSI